MQQDMEYIMAVYETGSISKAAERMFISQPALSMSIRKTEEAVGKPLFDRSSRPIRLTEAGRILVESLKKIRQTEQEMNWQLKDLDDLNTGSIYMGGSHYINAIAMTGFLTYFHRKYPGLALKIAEGSSLHLTHLLSEHQIDVIFSCDAEYVREFPGYPIFTDHILLHVPGDDPINQVFRDYRITEQDLLEKKHLRSDCPEVDLKWFQDLEFILLKEKHLLRESALAMFREAGVTPKVVLELAQLSTARRLSVAGYAATFVLDRMIGRRPSGACYYKIRSANSLVPYYALLPRQEYTPKAVRVFVRELQSYFGS